MAQLSFWKQWKLEKWNLLQNTAISFTMSYFKIIILAACEAFIAASFYKISSIS
jgi:hypothetical protein